MVPRHGWSKKMNEGEMQWLLPPYIISPSFFFLFFIMGEEEASKWFKKKHFPLDFLVNLEKRQILRASQRVDISTDS